MGTKLTALQVKNLTKGKHGVDRGLRIHANGDGTGAWLIRYTIHGKDKEVSGGTYPDVSLAEARELVAEYKAKARRGSDPLSEAKQAEAEVKAAAITFREVTELALIDFKPEWKCGGTRNGFLTKLDTYIYPGIGDTALADVNGKMLADMVRPMWHTQHPTAHKVLLHVNEILGWADAAEYECDPMAVKRARRLLGKSRHQSTPQKAMHWKDLPTHYQALTGTMADIAEAFYLLTIPRTVNVTDATWDQISVCGTLWIIPDTKNGREHVVPLPTQAQTLLDRAVEFYEKRDGYIFKNPQAHKKQRVSANNWTQKMRRAGVQATSHGARGSFKTWAEVNRVEETKIIEECLMHAVRPAQEAVYLPDPLTARRRFVMQAWADLLCGETSSNVVQFNAHVA